MRLLFSLASSMPLQYSGKPTDILQMSNFSSLGSILLSCAVSTPFTISLKDQECDWYFL